MHPCHSSQHREGVRGIGHLVVYLSHQCIIYCNRLSTTDDWSSFISNTYCTWLPVLTWRALHFLGFQCKPISCIAPLADLKTLISLALDDANTLRSSIYNRWVTFVPISFESLYPSVAPSSQATGFRHKVKRRRQRASP